MIVFPESWGIYLGDGSIINVFALNYGLVIILALTGLLEDIWKSSGMSSLFIRKNFTIYTVNSKNSRIDEIRVGENTVQWKVL